MAILAEFLRGGEEYLEANISNQGRPQGKEEYLKGPKSPKGQSGM